MLSQKVKKTIAKVALMLGFYGAGVATDNFVEKFQEPPLTYEVSTDESTDNKADEIIDNKIVGTTELNDTSRNFHLVDFGNYENNKIKENENLINSNIPFGILINSEVANERELKEELDYIKEILIQYDVTYPLFLNISSLKDAKDYVNFSGDRIGYQEVIDEFINTFGEFVCLYGDQSEFEQLGEKYNNNLKAIIINNNETYNYQGNCNFICFENNKNIMLFADQKYQLNDSYEKETEETINIENENSELLKGIDVSKFQGEIDWETVKNQGVDFAIIRVCDFANKNDDGSPQLDEYFKTNMEKCQDLGIPVGVYAYSRAENETEAQKEAIFVLNSVKDYNLQYPIYLDFESDNHKKIIETDLEKAINICDAFGKTIEDEGFYFGIYSSASVLEKLSPLNEKYNFWVARYDGQPCTFENAEPNEKVEIGYTTSVHQCTDKATIDGINGTVDVNFADPSLPQSIKNKQLNQNKTLIR